jgi:hypothetical protein
MGIDDIRDADVPQSKIESKQSSEGVTRLLK